MVSTKSSLFGNLSLLRCFIASSDKLEKTNSDMIIRSQTSSSTHFQVTDGVRYCTILLYCIFGTTGVSHTNTRLMASPHTSAMPGHVMISC